MNGADPMRDARMPQARKSLGQHFLRDRAVVERIIAALAPHGQDHVIEIGPGRGALTEYLSDRVARLDLVELDAVLAARLRDRFSSHTVYIHHTSALNFDYCRPAAHSGPVRILGNLPYNISTPILFKLLDHASCIADMCLMLQKEVVDRISASPGTKTYGRLSVMVQSRCTVEELFDVAPAAFAPAPQVESAVLRLTPYDRPPHDIPDRERFADVVRIAFGHRRKTLRNALKPVLTEASIRAAGVDPQNRAEQLSVADFAALSRAR